MWTTENKSEIACCLASIILIQNNIPISELNITLILNCAEVKIENYWPSLFSKLMKDSEVVSSKSSPILEESTPIKKEKADENKKQANNSDISKESEEDLGFGLFD